MLWLGFLFKILIDCHCFCIFLVLHLSRVCMRWRLSPPKKPPFLLLLRHNFCSWKCSSPPFQNIIVQHVLPDWIAVASTKAQLLVMKMFFPSMSKYNSPTFVAQFTAANVPALFSLGPSASVMALNAAFVASIAACVTACTSAILSYVFWSRLQRLCLSLQTPCDVSFSFLIEENTTDSSVYFCIFIFSLIMNIHVDSAGYENICVMSYAIGL